jgi:hypothetical protein
MKTSSGTLPPRHPRRRCRRVADGGSHAKGRRAGKSIRLSGGSDNIAGDWMDLYLE